MTEARHRCVLITGASSGLGAEFARQLAGRSQRMVLVARRKDRMAKLEKELRGIAPGLEVGSIAADLALAEDRVALGRRLEGTAWAPSLLVNNAGLGDYGEFATAEWSKLEAMMQVNMTALTHLTHEFLPQMLEDGDGAIINVSSLSSILPIPDFAVYAASKAYVSSFSEALRIEVRERGVSVLAVCPGPVHTEFGERARRGGEEEENPLREWFFAEAEDVVAESLRALARDQARVYPGWKIALAAAGISLVPLAVLRLVLSSRPRKVAD
ncbi:MAG: SDR family oxidoreductase [Verrucomicrobia bacterium]|nr:SDR family oxidoreductase [Verrucomicrobiota bacterium]